ncbi:hypothetical protein PAHAL_9G169400 [Panicum hallii]|uniref:Uncharacterized protein n=1 Tax=Panicum hallii TaxID=206008 RepID=A0A2T8I1H9_9POAL|nr:hypothetical protein PAHAL_9G169400 [Panicum hallii]
MTCTTIPVPLPKGCTKVRATPLLEYLGILMPHRHSEAQIKFLHRLCCALR